MLAGCHPDVSPNLQAHGLETHAHRHAGCMSRGGLQPGSSCHCGGTWHRPQQWEEQGQIFGFWAKDVEPANSPPIQEKSTSDTEMPQPPRSLAVESSAVPGGKLPYSHAHSNTRSAASNEG